MTEQHLDTAKQLLETIRNVNGEGNPKTQAIIASLKSEFENLPFGKGDV